MLFTCKTELDGAQPETHVSRHRRAGQNSAGTPGCCERASPRLRHTDTPLACSLIESQMVCVHSSACSESYSFSRRFDVSTLCISSLTLAGLNLGTTGHVGSSGQHDVGGFAKGFGTSRARTHAREGRAQDRMCRQLLQAGLCSAARPTGPCRAGAKSRARNRCEGVSCGSPRGRGRALKNLLLFKVWSDHIRVLRIVVHGGACPRTRAARLVRARAAVPTDAWRHDSACSGKVVGWLGLTNSRARRAGDFAWEAPGRWCAVRPPPLDAHFCLTRKAFGTVRIDAAEGQAGTVIGQSLRDPGLGHAKGRVQCLPRTLCLLTAVARVGSPFLAPVFASTHSHRCVRYDHAQRPAVARVLHGRALCLSVRLSLPPPLAA